MTNEIRDDITKVEADLAELKADLDAKEVTEHPVVVIAPDSHVIDVDGMDTVFTPIDPAHGGAQEDVTVGVTVLPAYISQPDVIIKTSVDPAKGGSHDFEHEEIPALVVPEPTTISSTPTEPDQGGAIENPEPIEKVLPVEQAPEVIIALTPEPGIVDAGGSHDVGEEASTEPTAAPPQDAADSGEGTQVSTTPAATNEGGAVEDVQPVEPTPEAGIAAPPPEQVAITETDPGSGGASDFVPMSDTSITEIIISAESTPSSGEGIVEAASPVGDGAPVEDVPITDATVNVVPIAPSTDDPGANVQEVPHDLPVDLAVDKPAVISDPVPVETPPSDVATDTGSSGSTPVADVSPATNSAPAPAALEVPVEAQTPIDAATLFSDTALVDVTTDAPAPVDAPVDAGGVTDAVVPPSAEDPASIDTLSLAGDVPADQSGDTQVP